MARGSIGRGDGKGDKGNDGAADRGDIGRQSPFGGVQSRDPGRMSNDPAHGGRGLSAEQDRARQSMMQGPLGFALGPVERATEALGLRGDYSLSGPPDRNLGRGGTPLIQAAAPAPAPTTPPALPPGAWAPVTGGQPNPHGLSFGWHSRKDPVTGETIINPGGAASPLGLPQVGGGPRPPTAQPPNAPQPAGATAPVPTGQPGASATPQGATGLPSGTQHVPGIHKEGHSGTIPSIISKAGILGRAATTSGEQFANQRGLLNSSLAGEASHRALLAHAQGIAQSVADTRARNADRVVQERQQQAQIQSQERQQDKQISSQERQTQMQTDAQWRQTQSQNLNAALRQVQTSYAQQVSAITTNPQLSKEAREQAFTNLRTWTNKNIKLLNTLYNVQLDWSYV